MVFLGGCCKGVNLLTRQVVLAHRLIGSLLHTSTRLSKSYKPSRFYFIF